MLNIYLSLHEYNKVNKELSIILVFASYLFYLTSYHYIIWCIMELFIWCFNYKLRDLACETITKVVCILTKKDIKYYYIQKKYLKIKVTEKRKKIEEKKFIVFLLTHKVSQRPTTVSRSIIQRRNTLWYIFSIFWCSSDGGNTFSNFLKSLIRVNWCLKIWN